MGDLPSPEEAARSYFVSPELGNRDQEMTEHINWPICIRSRRGLHRSRAIGRDHDLALLREPNLSHLHQTNPDARVFRVLTHASFSPLPIAFRVEMNDAGGAVLHAAWLGGDAAQVASEAALSALPPQKSTQRLSDAGARALWSLLEEAIPRQSVLRTAIDGNWLVIEVIENGERTVRFEQLYDSPHPTGRLLCALAAQSEIPPRALEQGHVWSPCDDSTRT
jgi:hypothetical protein